MSATKPFPTQRPWSGGSNSRLKLETALSWLEVPLKFATSGDKRPERPEDVVPGSAVAGASADVWRGLRRAPWLWAAGPEPTVVLWPVARVATPVCAAA